MRGYPKYGSAVTRCTCRCRICFVPCRVSCRGVFVRGLLSLRLFFCLFVFVFVCGCRALVVVFGVLFVWGRLLIVRLFVCFFVCLFVGLFVCLCLCVVPWWVRGPACAS